MSNETTDHKSSCRVNREQRLLHQQGTGIQGMKYWSVNTDRCPPMDYFPCVQTMLELNTTAELLPSARAQCCGLAEGTSTHHMRTSITGLHNFAYRCDQILAEPITI